MRRSLLDRWMDVCSAALLAVSVMVVALVSSGCGPERELTPQEEAQAEMFAFKGELNPSPSNQYADDILAATLGQRLFFDKGMSADGGVACANCHDPAKGFSDPNPVSMGVDGRQGSRHAPGIVNVGAEDVFLWDGRADAVWSQALLAIENPKEMDFSRAEVAHYVAAQHSEAYEATFGALPDLSQVPQRAQPGDAAWEAMNVAQQEAVERVFANVGKALEAYQRRLTCANTHYDRVQRGEAELSREQEAGLVDFLRAGCVNCHGGEQFNVSPDGARFHNLGLESVGGDEGRVAGVITLLESRFNTASVYSDAPELGEVRLEALIVDDPRDVAAFKTPSLRGAVQRSRFFHDGSRGSIQEVLDFYAGQGGRRGRPGAGPLGDVAGIVDPALRELGNFDRRAVQAFLETLACEPIEAALLDPHPAWPSAN